MRFGLFAINYGTCADPDAAVAVARHAESVGFESVWGAEHVVLPVSASLGSPLPATLPMLDPLVALTLVANETTELRLGTGILILPLHNPVVLAKGLASLDLVCDGRLLVGVGAGYIREEFAAVGVPFEQRGPRMDEYLRALRTLWGSRQPGFDGRFVAFRGIDAHPRPRQQPHPPLVIGGESQPALTRAVTQGNGWYGFSLDLVQTRQCVTRLRQIAERRERPAELGPLELTVTPRENLDRDTVEQYAELGVTRLVLLPNPGAGHAERHRPVPLSQITANLDTVAERLMKD
ncbi:TIGR03619 family F420-dependent LLM class oxidoreductase [Streptomyces chartreusis]|uniref:TIGR03619 family F420-dependent LLM class oxidoreductase n=1 Tax=Streptomyces chartreusis TaxID=1969 RepID=UPI003643263B